MIEPVNEQNIDIAAAIHSESWKESHRAFCAPDFVELHSQEHQKEYLLEKMKAGTLLYMLFDEAYGKNVGIVSVTENLIEDLYILPAEQNKGYGTKLLRFACSKCPGKPTLWILENNLNAARLYQREGFSLTGRRNNIDKGLDEIEFIKE